MTRALPTAMKSAATACSARHANSNCVLPCAARASKGVAGKPASTLADESARLRSASATAHACPNTPKAIASTAIAAVGARAARRASDADIAPLQQVPQHGQRLVARHGDRVDRDPRRFEIDAVLRPHVLFDPQQVAVDGALGRQRHQREHHEVPIVAYRPLRIERAARAEYVLKPGLAALVVGKYERDERRRHLRVAREMDEPRVVERELVRARRKRLQHFAGNGRMPYA